PGVEEVRELIALRLQGYLNTYREIRSLGEEGAAQHLINLVKTSSSLPLDFAQLLARGRYHGRALDLAKEREVENPHFPASYTASFRSAQQALRQKYDVALIVGPEGFAYEPIFEDLGLPSIAVNIPEADFNGPRSFQSFDDLSALKGKRVLVVEDDVQSGATLRALLEALAPHAPSFLGLYLGAPPNRQITANIPKAFKRVVVTQIDEALDERAFMRHLQRRETVFIGRRGR
ncbi:MAG: phosphoribosyltransferase, partial [bacterium]